MKLPCTCDLFYYRAPSLQFLLLLRIPFYPAASFKMLPEISGDIDFWERHEAEKLLSFANEKYFANSPKRWIYTSYLLALNTAMRAGEIWGLYRSDVKYGSEVLHVQRQWDRVKYCYRLPKGKKPRFVPCNENLKQELETYLKNRKVLSNELLFQSRSGKPVCHDNFADKVFNRDVNEAGVREITFHGLRHTGTTLMIASGLDAYTVKEICGHKDISATMKYVHLLLVYYFGRAKASGRFPDSS